MGELLRLLFGRGSGFDHDPCIFILTLCPISWRSELQGGLGPLSSRDDRLGRLRFGCEELFRGSFLFVVLCGTWRDGRDSDRVGV